MAVSKNSPCCVAVLIETDDTWGRSVVEAITKHARSARWSLLIGPRDDQRRLRLPKRWQGSGVLVSLRDIATARHVQRSGLPAVDVSITMPGEQWLGRVATDDHSRAALAFEHFRERGLERFACYSPPIGRYPDSRALAFAEIAKQAGFDCPLFTRPHTKQASDWLADYQRATKWLAGFEKPLAVFASDPYPARQLAEICERNGIRIPDDVALIAGDNDELLCKVAWPQITSVELSSRLIGETACVMLSSQMAGKPIPKGPTLIPPTRVLPRHSTEILAIDDPEFCEVLSTIRDRAIEGLDVKALLREFPISRRGLEMKFKRYLGRAPAEEIRRVRLHHAHQLLLMTDKSVEAIAAASGFSSGPALSHAFRKQMNTTPSQLRASRTPKAD